MHGRFRACLALIVTIGAGCGAGRIIGGDDDDVADDAPPDRDGATPIDAPDGDDDAAPADARPDARIGTCEDPNLGSRTAPAFPAPSVSTSGLLVRVMNNCPFPLWIHGAGNGGGTVLQPDDVRLGTGETRDYDATSTLNSARVTAFGDGPRQREVQFVELNFGNGELGYNISYVDYLGLPVEAAGSCGTTACYAPVDGILDGCPSQLALADRCLSPGSWCNSPDNQDDPYCKALDSSAAEALSGGRCADEVAAWRNSHGGAAPGTTPSVYGCRDFWASSAFCCAIVNRGVVGAADPAAICGFYQDDPYNTYARWVHERCPQIYAFPYDDAFEQGGYHQCQSRELRITWCPGG